MKENGEEDGKREDKTWQPMKENCERNIDRLKKIELGQHCLI